MSIVSIRKQDVLRDTRDEGLREDIERSSNDPAIVQKMLKDIHLTEASLRPDRIVVSLDDSVADRFASVREDPGAPTDPRDQPDGRP